MAMSRYCFSRFVSFCIGAENLGVTCAKILDVPAEPQKFDFLYTNFLPNYSPITATSIPFLIEKHPILPKLGAFYNNLLKIHPIF